MKRYPAFDPPEYVAWQRDDAAVGQFRETLRRDRARAKVIAQLSREQMLAMYRGLLRNRLSDIALKRMVRQGVISKAWLGTGEEAATIGPVHALRRGPGGDVVAPMIRNSGACHEMGMPVADIFRAYMGTADGPSRGRDGHYGSFSVGVLPPISHVGDVVPVVTGIALSSKAGRRAGGQAGGVTANGIPQGPDTRGGRANLHGGALHDGAQQTARARAVTARQPACPPARLRIALTWIGDGTTKAGVTHEGLNFAAVQRVPAIFIIQNNQVALGTRLDHHNLAAGRGNFPDWPQANGCGGAAFAGTTVT